ncbi:hypothetical protein TNCV_4092021 [Trichonephila clavipes]|nr:hypothetical protein TNCV_4092021 [Trichonephila clavipes]
MGSLTFTGCSNRTLHSAWSPDWSRYLIFLEQVLPKLLDRAHVTAATRTSMWFQQDGAPHISVFLFGITWMQYVVNDGLAGGPVH